MVLDKAQKVSDYNGDLVLLRDTTFITYSPGAGEKLNFLNLSKDPVLLQKVIESAWARWLVDVERVNPDTTMGTMLDNFPDLWEALFNTNSLYYIPLGYDDSGVLNAGIFYEGYIEYELGQQIKVLLQNETKEESGEDVPVFYKIEINVRGRQQGTWNNVPEVTVNVDNGITENNYSVTGETPIIINIRDRININNPYTITIPDTDKYIEYTETVPAPVNWGGFNHEIVNIVLERHELDHETEEDTDNGVVNLEEIPDLTEEWYDALGWNTEQKKARYINDPADRIWYNAHRPVKAWNELVKIKDIKIEPGNMALPITVFRWLWFEDSNQWGITIDKARESVSIRNPFKDTLLIFTYWEVDFAETVLGNENISDEADKKYTGAIAPDSSGLIKLPGIHDKILTFYLVNANKKAELPSLITGMLEEAEWVNPEEEKEYGRSVGEPGSVFGLVVFITIVIVAVALFLVFRNRKGDA